MDSGLPVKRTIADQVAELIRQRILSGQLKGGQPIRQEHLAAELGVSRIPLREALKQLAAEGFVTITSHKGAVVAELSIQEVEELFEIRLRLETWLLQLAIPAMTDRDLAALDRNMEEQRRPDILPHWGDVNWRFHEIMYLPANRPISLKLLDGERGAPLHALTGDGGRPAHGRGEADLDGRRRLRAGRECHDQQQDDRQRITHEGPSFT